MANENQGAAGTAAATVPAVAPDLTKTIATQTPGAAQAVPGAERPRDEAGKFVKASPSGIPEVKRVAIPAKTALKLEKDPKVEANEEMQRSHEKSQRHAPVTLSIEAPSSKLQAPEKSQDPTQLPNVEAPAETAAATVEPPKPATPAKIKIGEKEYSEAELQEQLKAAEEFRKAQEAKANESVLKPKQAPAAPNPPTAEEIKAREAQFVEAAVKVLADGASVSITEPELDVILNGGPEAVKLLAQMRQRDIATAILHARKSLAPDLNDIIGPMQEEIQFARQQRLELEQWKTEQAFIQKYPHFKEGRPLEIARHVAQRLWAEFPDQVAKLTREQFIGEVVRQASPHVEREYVAYRQRFPEAPEDWKQFWTKAGQQAQPTPNAATQTAGTVPPVPAQAQPAQPPPVKPPAATSPVPAGGVPMRDFHKSVAHSLRG